MPKGRLRPDELPRLFDAEAGDKDVVAGSSDFLPPTIGLCFDRPSAGAERSARCGCCTATGEALLW